MKSSESSICRFLCRGSWIVRSDWADFHVAGTFIAAVRWCWCVWGEGCCDLSGETGLAGPDDDAVSWAVPIRTGLSRVIQRVLRQTAYFTPKLRYQDWVWGSKSWELTRYFTWIFSCCCYLWWVVCDPVWLNIWHQNSLSQVLIPLFRPASPEEICILAPKTSDFLTAPTVMLLIFSNVCCFNIPVRPDDGDLDSFCVFYATEHTDRNCHGY